MSSEFKNLEVKDKAKSLAKLAALIGFMAFLYINLLAGGVLTVGAGAIVIRWITGQ